MVMILYMVCMCDCCSEICYPMTKSEDSSHVLSEEDQGAVGGHDPSEGEK